MQMALGIFIICAMIYLLIKRYETRTVLFGAGMLMAFVAGDPMGPLVAFSKSMKQSNIFEVIIASMGFAAVVKATACDRHLIAVFVKVLKKLGPFLILGVALTTMVLNISIPSAAGIAAAVGIILIPLLTSSGISAPIAVAAVMAGTYGSTLNPGHVHPTLVAEIAKKTSMEFVSLAAMPVIVSVVVSSLGLIAISFWMKRKQQSMPEAAVQEAAALDGFKLNYCYALLPLVPLLILILGSSGFVPVLKMPVSHAMIIGALMTLLITRSKPAQISKAFFKGMGDSFGSIFGLIITANIFVAGMNSLGLIKTLIYFMTHSPSIAILATVFGPFGMTIISGSGEAASIAFNTAVVVHAEQFGMQIMDMGAVTVISGGIGRAISPVAGCMIICAEIAKVNPIEVIKYSAVPMVAALFTVTAMLLF